MRSTICAILILVAEAASAADLHGTIISPDGKPVALASVRVYTVIPKTGAEKYAPLNHPDCQRTVTSNDRGEFTVARVDPSMKYELLILADGYRPLALRKVDPLLGQINAKLSLPPKNVPADRLAKGHIVDADGKPVVGAWIQTHGVRNGPQRNWGGGEVVEPETWTDSKGEFTLVCQKSDLLIWVEIHGLHEAPMVFALSPGDPAFEINLIAGVSVSGRIVKDGHPIGGAELRLAQIDRNFDKWIGEFVAVTADDGTFSYKHLAPDEQYNLWAITKTLGDSGYLPTTNCTTTGDGTTVNLGDVTLERAFAVSGQIVCADDKPLPAGTKIHLRRTDLDDQMECTVSDDGKFEFKSAPGDVCSMNLTVAGYYFSSENQSYSSLENCLVGMVDQDINDLRIKLELGTRPRERVNFNQMQTLRGMRLSGAAP